MKDLLMAFFLVFVITKGVSADILPGNVNMEFVYMTILLNLEYGKGKIKKKQKRL